MTSPPCRSRRLLLFATAAWAAWPHAVFAQVVGPYRVALVFTTTPVVDMVGDRPVHPGARAFVEALGANGFVPGRDLIYEPRSAEGRYERYPAIFAELVNLRTDAIVTVGDDMTRQARAATATVPIVMAYSNAPVEAGLVRSLARPGGNVTGLAPIPRRRSRPSACSCCMKRFPPRRGSRSSVCVPNGKTGLDRACGPRPCGWASRCTSPRSTPQTTNGRSLC